MPDPAHKPPVDPSRRRLIKGGAAAAPAFWVVASRPVRAGAATECVAPSADGSLEASGPSAVRQLCSGYAPEYWSNPENFDRWPAPYLAKSDRVIVGYAATQFHATGCSGGYFGGRTMVDVLAMAGQGGYEGLGAHVAAAILNAAAGLTPVLTVPQVLAMWNDCTGMGYYEPTAGTRWTADELIRYLQTTMPNRA